MRKRKGGKGAFIVAFDKNSIREWGMCYFVVRGENSNKKEKLKVANALPFKLGQLSGGHPRGDECT